MSTHFRISLGLIMAGCLHFVVLNNYQLNQSITYIEKERTLNIVLIKTPKNKPAPKMPVEILTPPVIEKKPVQPQKLMKPKAKSVKKINKKQKIKKLIIEEKEPDIKETELNKPAEISQETSSLEFQENYQEITQKKPILKTIGCAEYSHCPKPQYPFVAKQRNIKGWVKLALKINEAGSVIDAKILASEPEEIFEEAALEAVKQWKNLPEQLYNKTFEQLIQFNLND